MSDPLNRFNRPVPHVEQQRDSKKMRDWSELDNLKADIRTQGRQQVVMPWRTGRPLRSAGRPQTSGKDEGCPVTPLADLDLQAAVTAGEKARLGRELDRATTLDRVSEGVLDTAEAMGVPLEVEETLDDLEKDDLEP